MTHVHIPGKGTKPRSLPEQSHEAGAVDSAQLLAGRAEIRIVHNGHLYRLRATKNGKLILTK